MRKTIKPKTGMRFGILTIISNKEVKKRGLYFWKCKCDCGTKLDVWNHNLLSGNTKACRCVTRESINKSCKTHGMTHTRPWNIWYDMKRRCNDSRRKCYVRYGGRGIKVCKKWEDSFENFRDDMYKSYVTHVKKYGEKNTTIDRIDNDDNYELKNCKWSTQKEQANNRRTIIRI